MPFSETSSTYSINLSLDHELWNRLSFYSLVRDDMKTSNYAAFLIGTNNSDHLKPLGLQQFIIALGDDDTIDVTGTGVYDGGTGADTYNVANIPNMYAWVCLTREDGDKLDVTELGIRSFDELMTYARMVEARNDDAIWNEHVAISLPNGTEINLDDRRIEDLRAEEFIFAKDIKHAVPPTVPSTNVDASSHGSPAEDAVLIGQAIAPEASPADQL
jgi:hypothetical protein